MSDSAFFSFLKPFFRILAIAICLQATPLFAEEGEDLFAKGIVVDLREPHYCEGVLCTEIGGVITAQDMRIQATNIRYTRKMEDGIPIYTVSAEGDLVLEYGEYIFVGERLEYDFQSKSGLIYVGRTMIEPWFFGGDTVELCSDGSYIIHQGFVTTSTNLEHPEWQIALEKATIYEDHYLDARHVQFRIMKLPVFWIPTFKINLDSIFDSPIRYNIRWGGRQGPRVGLIYELFSWKHWKAFLRLDYRVTRGPGAGFETHYRSEDRRASLDTINYFSYDSSLARPSERHRYRFQGIYRHLLFDDKVDVSLMYDKLSDKYMATDYTDRGLELDTAGKTQFLVRRQDENWISNFLTRLRINSFQTVKQELPTFEHSWHPFNLGRTGIISETSFKASYLDFAYSSNLVHVHDFNSTRIELAPRYYRPFQFSNLTATPEVGGVGIFYGNSPEKSAKWLVVGQFGCSLNTYLHKSWDKYKHVMGPYAKYDYYTYPSVSPNDHYIFDIEDGWYRLNVLRFGVTHGLYSKNESGCMSRPLYADLYANAFFDTKTLPNIPKVYADITWYSFPTLKHVINTAWDFSRNLLDHFNVRTEWTLSPDFAIMAEYRYRDAYAWRKVDYSNFIIDSYRSSSALRHSTMSDRRDTLLLNFFYRFHPCWALQFESRQGWNREYQPNYTEFEFDLLGSLRSAWNVKISYQHRENDDRVAAYFSIGLKRPSCEKACGIVPCLEF